MPKAIGVDVGSKRIGVAASSTRIATPVAVVDRTGDAAADAAAVIRLATEREATTVVVGLPLNMSGSRGPAAETAEAFADLLRAAGFEVHMWDERLTTVQSERALIEAGVRRADRKKVVDKLAATVILQAWLDANPLG